MYCSQQHWYPARCSRLALAFVFASLLIIFFCHPQKLSAVEPSSTENTAVSSIAGTLIHEQWFDGSLNQQPALRAHELITQVDPQHQRYTFQMDIMIARSLFGNGSVLTIQQKRTFVEDTNGQIQSFYFEDSENGKITSATGVIVGDQVQATIITPTTTSDSTLKIPPEKTLLGPLGSQRLMMQKLQHIGDAQKMCSLEMVSGHLHIITTTSTLNLIKDNKNKIFSARVDLMPTTPVTLEVDTDGYTQQMSMSMGGLIDMTFQAADKAMPLEAADFKISSLIRQKGGQPKIGDNRYRINASVLKNIQNDAFQTSHDDILSVRNQAQKSTLEVPNNYLDAELQIEINDPQLIAWAKQQNAHHADKSIAEQAEILRLAVRSYITHKDLSQGDASALETFHSRRGDCTEHANLLCAALRINQIPARTEVGFIYVANVRRWVGHAWCSAYDSEQGRWIHLDAAYPGIQRSQYIKTGSSAGFSGTSTAEAMTKGMSALIGQEIEVLP